MPEGDLPGLAAAAAERGGNLANPKPASPDEIEQLLREVYEHRLLNPSLTSASAGVRALDVLVVCSCGCVIHGTMVGARRIPPTRAVVKYVKPAADSAADQLASPLQLTPQSVPEAVVVDVR